MIFEDRNLQNPNSGTQLNADNLNKGNWRDDKSVSFMKREDNALPSPKVDETQIVTLVDGKTWLLPPTGYGEAEKLGQCDVDSKLDKITKLTALPQVYVKDRDGTNTMVDYSRVVDPWSIVARDGYGQIELPSNPSPTQAVRKDYIDSKVETVYVGCFDVGTGNKIIKSFNSGIYTLIWFVSDGAYGPINVNKIQSGGERSFTGIKIHSGESVIVNSRDNRIAVTKLGTNERATWWNNNGGTVLDFSLDGNDTRSGWHSYQVIR